MSDEILDSSVTTDTVRLSPGITYNVSVNQIDRSQIIINHSVPFSHSTVYTVTLTANGVKDLQGNGILNQFTFDWTIAPPDYGFAPGRTEYDVDGSLLLSRIPNTVVIDLRGRRGIRDVKSFINHLSRSAGITKPVKDLIILTHGNSSGYMQIDLNKGGRSNTTYEDLVDAVTNPSNSVQIPDSLHCPAGQPCTDPVRFNVHIRGCRIGKAQPFVEKLKEAFSSPQSITAPKHFHGAGFSGPRQPVRNAYSYEFLAYSFELYRVHVPGRTFRQLQGIPPENRQLLSRDEVLSAFVNHNPHFKFIDGVDVPELPPVGDPDLPSWQDLIPPNLRISINSSTGERRFVRWFDLGLNISNVQGRNDRRMEIGTWFRHTVGQWPYDSLYIYTIPTNTNPGNTTNMLSIFHDSVSKDPTFQPSDPLPPPDPPLPPHPFPQYIRHGYNTAGDFLDGYSWVCEWRQINIPRRGDRGIVCTGTRHVYTVLLPIVDRTTKSLYFNLFPAVPGPTSNFKEVLNLRLDNSGLFLTV